MSQHLDPVEAQTSSDNWEATAWKDHSVFSFLFLFPVFLLSCFLLHEKIAHRQAASPWLTTSCVQEKDYRSWLWRWWSPAGSSAGWVDGICYKAATVAIRQHSRIIELKVGLGLFFVLFVSEVTVSCTYLIYSVSSIWQNTESWSTGKVSDC